MKTASIAHARANLSELVNRVKYQGRCTILTSRGKPVALLGPIDEATTTNDPKRKTKRT